MIKFLILEKKIYIYIPCVSISMERGSCIAGYVGVAVKNGFLKAIVM